MPSLSNKGLQQGYLGIDPGESGGAAIVLGNRILASISFDLPRRKVFHWFWSNRMVSGIARERVGAFPGQGRSSIFTFGTSYGFLEACIYHTGLPDELICNPSPQKWLKALGIGTRPKGMRDSAWKSSLMERAKIWFPRQRITKSIADAALIAKYCELTFGKE